MTIVMIALSTTSCKLNLMCKNDPYDFNQIVCAIHWKCGKKYNENANIFTFSGTIEDFNDLKVGYFLHRQDATDLQGPAAPNGLCKDIFKFDGFAFEFKDEGYYLEIELPEISINSLNKEKSQQYFKHGYVFFNINDDKCPRAPFNVNPIDKSVLESLHGVI